MLRTALLVAAFVAAGTSLCTGPAAAQSESSAPEVRVQRPDKSVLPGKTYRLNDLEKKQIEAQKQKEYEEAAARAFGGRPVTDPAADLAQVNTNPRDRSTGNAAVKKLIDSRPGATFNY
jgi:hypothetical protein